jgi:apolipoprotein N-acyltransferase
MFSKFRSRRAKGEWAFELMLLSFAVFYVAGFFWVPANFIPVIPNVVASVLGTIALIGLGFSFLMIVPIVVSGRQDKKRKQLEAKVYHEATVDVFLTELENQDFVAWCHAGRKA